MGPMLLASALLSGLLIVAGCSGSDAAISSDPGAAFDTIDPGAGGAADGSGLAQDTSLGATHRATLRALPPGTPATASTLRGRALLLRFPVDAGQTFAVIMRSTTAAYDPYLIVKGPDLVTLGFGDDQAALPMAAETDALLVHTANVGGNYHVLAADRGFAENGDVQVDIIALTEDPGVSLSVTNPSLRAHATALRSLDARVAANLLDGALVEGADGYVTIDRTVTATWPLRDVAALRGTVSDVNWSRGALFAEFVAAADITAPDAPQLGSVARVCAELWAAAR